MPKSEKTKPKGKLKSDVPAINVEAPKDSSFAKTTPKNPKDPKYIVPKTPIGAYDEEEILSLHADESKMFNVSVPSSSNLSTISKNEYYRLRHSANPTGESSDESNQLVSDALRSRLKKPVSRKTIKADQQSSSVVLPEPTKQRAKTKSPISAESSEEGFADDENESLETIIRRTKRITAMTAKKK